MIVPAPRVEHEVELRAGCPCRSRRRSARPPITPFTTRRSRRSTSELTSAALNPRALTGPIDERVEEHGARRDVSRDDTECQRVRRGELHARLERDRSRRAASCSRRCRARTRADCPLTLTVTTGVPNALRRSGSVDRSARNVDHRRRQRRERARPPLHRSRGAASESVGSTVSGSAPIARERRPVGLPRERHRQPDARPRANRRVGRSDVQRAERDGRGIGIARHQRAQRERERPLVHVRATPLRTRHVEHGDVVPEVCARLDVIEREPSQRALSRRTREHVLDGVGGRLRPHVLPRSRRPPEAELPAATGERREETTTNGRWGRAITE